MGNVITTTEETWKLRFIERCYQDIARSRIEMEEDIKDIDLQLADDLISPQEAEERIRAIKEVHSKYEIDIISMIEKEEEEEKVYHSQLGIENEEVEEL